MAGLLTALSVKDEATFRACLPGSPSRDFIGNFSYSLGFVAVNSRAMQQFAGNTIVSVLPVTRVPCAQMPGSMASP